MTKEIVVSKLGSSLIADRATGIRTKQIRGYTKGIMANHPDSSHILVVSGAREMGMFRAKKMYGKQERRRLTDKQLAGLGATAVFHGFEKAFERLGQGASSYPVTHHLLEGTDPEIAEERRSFIDVLLGNAESGIVSIINEADAMNDKELMMLALGATAEVDNDTLSSHIARAVGARSLDLWTSKGGIEDSRGRFVPEINLDNINQTRHMLEIRPGSISGRGGIGPKLEAAWDAASAGIHTRIAGVNADMSGANVTHVVVR